MRNLFFLILVIQVFLFSCVKEDLENDETLYTGYDSRGELDSCKKIKPHTICDMSFDVVEDQFGIDCTNSGFTAIQCDCHKYLCVEGMPKLKVKPAEMGYDINGNIRTCKAMPKGSICPAVMLEGDEFADRCKEDGYTPFKCGCNDFICVGGMPNYNQVLKGTGLDMNGILRTCNAMPDDLNCATEVTEGDEFAYACKDAGNTPFQCGCHDFICLPSGM